MPAFLFLLGNLRLALRGFTKPYVVFPGGGDLQPIVLDPRHFGLVAIALSALLGFFLSVVASSQWLTILRFLEPTPFGQADPAARLRRRLLRLHAALPRHRALHLLRAGRAGRDRLDRRLRRRRPAERGAGGLLDRGAGPAAPAAPRRGGVRPPGLGRLPRHPAPADDAVRHRLRRLVRRRQPAAVRSARAGGRLGRGDGRYRVRRFLADHVAGGGRRRRLPPGLDRRRGYGDGAAAARRHPRRAAAGGALPGPQHRRDTAGLRSRRGRGAAGLRRRPADAPGHPGQRGDHQQRTAVGPPAAARHVRADPGDPHLLRVRVGGQRPLRGRRRVPPDDALEPRAQLGQPAEPLMGQRAAAVHTRLRRGARPGQPGDAGRSAGAVHPGPAAAFRDRPGRRAAEHLLRRAVERLRPGQHRHRRVPLPGGRGQRLDPLRRHRRRRDRRPVPPPPLQPAVPLLRDSRQRPVERGTAG